MACCAAALFMIGLTSQGHSLARHSALATRPSVNSRDRILQAHAAPSSRTNSSTSPSVMEHYRQFPLSFEPNVKQTNNADVKFLARGNGYILFLTGKDAVLSMGKDPQSTAVIRMSLLGANAASSFSGIDELPGKSNYFIGNKPENWHTNIPNYRKVAEHNIYPGIDLIYYGTQRQLEYDFVIAPGTSPSKIQIAFRGAKNLHTDANGDLILSAAGTNDVRLHKPVAYQQNGNEKQLVAANYILNGKGRVAFSIGNYDQSLPLIVDPILAYSTYLGGSGIDGANAIAIAPDNTAFIAGSTFSTDFPTIHALQVNDGGSQDYPQDAFVSKISADGSTLLYSTYLGGTHGDAANGIAVDNSGNAFVVGSTGSTNFPVGPFFINALCGGDGKCGTSWNPQNAQVTNGFITKLNAAGSGILYSSYIGEYEDVFAQAVAVDADDNAYVTGITTPNFTPTVTITPPALPPPPFPITASAFQTTIVGNNAFVMKIGSIGNNILYSSYLGGSVEDIGYGIGLDSNANAYITGLTYSPDLATTAGALQPTYGGAGDGFIAKVNPNAIGAASLNYLTYFGGNGLDQGNAIAVDTAGNAYVAGATSSTTFGIAANGFQTANKGQGDAFIVKLTTTGTLSYFTYLGGSKADAATGIALDPATNVYVTGSTVSTDFPTAGAVFQPNYGGGNADSFVAKLDPTGKTLLYSSYLGGTNTELASGIAVDTTGSAYVTGQTCSEDFPLANPLQAVPGGNCDAYVAKVSILAGFALNPAGLVFPAQSLNTTSASQTVTLTNGDSGQTISSIVINGANLSDYTETNTCGSSLAIGATCTITVSFTPSAPGLRKASLTITDSAPGSPQIVNLSGNTSTVTLSSSSLAFGLQQVGVASAPQAVTVTNSGTTALTISGITASGDFTETDDCVKALLQPSTNCVIQVTFTPSAAVGSIGAITLTDNGSGSPQVILTTGTGVLVPRASLSTASLGFASQPVGVTSAAQPVTLTNTGNAPLTISNIATTGNFGETSACGTIISPNASCTINVTFTPAAAGANNGSLTITDNDPNTSPQTVFLSGTGLAIPIVNLSTTTLTFNNQGIGTTSAPQTVTLTNVGSAALTISSVTASGPFAQINNCPTSIAVGGNCAINITFSPSVGGNLFGTVTVADNATNNPQTITMSGTGTGASFQVSSLTAAPAVPAGKPATYAISVVAFGGFSQQVALNCVAPATLSCIVTPNVVTPSASPTQSATVTVNTSLRTIAPPGSRIKIDPLTLLKHLDGISLLLMAAILMVMTAAIVRRRPFTAAFGFTVVLLLASVACSNGGSAAGSTVGTPAGNYQVTVIATSGSVSTSTTLSLQVN
ncbi:MAG TPA: choice-of-anchor D domain-containing protein [Candidatus Saccharimonadales bacterium]|nr:choice-of-anchor D domain-containing protein [Candidatus Saccharimonadales bacterium]